MLNAMLYVYTRLYCCVVCVCAGLMNWLCNCINKQEFFSEKKDLFWGCLKCASRLHVANFLSQYLDIWSAGCVFAELLLGQPIFPGDSGVDQLVEIIKVLGTPTKEQIRQMNSNYTEFKFPQIKPHPWSKVCFANHFMTVFFFFFGNYL